MMMHLVFVLVAVLVAMSGRQGVCAVELEFTIQQLTRTPLSAGNDTRHGLLKDGLILPHSSKGDQLYLNVYDGAVCVDVFTKKKKAVINEKGTNNLPPNTQVMARGKGRIVYAVENDQTRDLPRVIAMDVSNPEKPEVLASWNATPQNKSQTDPCGMECDVWAIALSPDGSTLAVLTGTLGVWLVDTSKVSGGTMSGKLALTPEDAYGENAAMFGGIPVWSTTKKDAYLYLPMIGNAGEARGLTSLFACKIDQKKLTLKVVGYSSSADAGAVTHGPKTSPLVLVDDSYVFALVDENLVRAKRDMDDNGKVDLTKPDAKNGATGYVVWDVTNPKSPKIIDYADDVFEDALAMQLLPESFTDSTILAVSGPTQDMVLLDVTDMDEPKTLTTTFEGDDTFSYVNNGMFWIKDGDDLVMFSSTRSPMSDTTIFVTSLRMSFSEIPNDGDKKVPWETIYIACGVLAVVLLACICHCCRKSRDVGSVQVGKLDHLYELDEGVDNTSIHDPFLIDSRGQSSSTSKMRRVV